MTKENEEEEEKAAKIYRGDGGGEGVDAGMLVVVTSWRSEA